MAFIFLLMSKVAMFCDAAAYSLCVLRHPTTSPQQKQRITVHTSVKKNKTNVLRRTTNMCVYFQVANHDDEACFYPVVHGVAPSPRWVSHYHQGLVLGYRHGKLRGVD